jgi:hypothetical protein
MNEASPEKPRRVPGRLAAATAAALGATLLTYPGGIASAQEIDCAALGADPVEGTLESALDAAIACEVEVRFENRTWPYSTVYVTPEGQLHLVSTAAPEQRWTNQGVPDPTLMEYDGSLVQTWQPAVPRRRVVDAAQWRTMTQDPSPSPRTSE